MKEKNFWHLIDIARSDKSSVDIGSYYSILTSKLKGLTDDELISFESIRQQLLLKSSTWDIWAAACIINHGCGDDDFVSFRCGLIAQGEVVFYQTLNNPEEALLDFPEAAKLEKYEIFDYVASTVWEERKDLVEGAGIPLSEREPAQLIGPQFGEQVSDDDKSLQHRFPRLFARYRSG